MRVSTKGGKTKFQVPSSADIAQQTRTMFENAGKDVAPIIIKNESQALMEIEKIVTNLGENIEWDVQVKAMKRAMGLLNGGALEFHSFISNINSLSDGLLRAALNLRSALVKSSCLLISQLAQSLKAKFTVMGEFITPLSKQTSHGTLIIAESCKLAIQQISKNCPTKTVLYSVGELMTSKALANRQIAADCFILIFQFWSPAVVSKNADFVMKALRTLLTDAQQEVKVTARIAAKMFATRYPKFSDFFLITLDERTKKAVMDSIVPEDPRKKSSPRKRSSLSPEKVNVSPHLLKPRMSISSANANSDTQSRRILDSPPEIESKPKRRQKLFKSESTDNNNESSMTKLPKPLKLRPEVKIEKLRPEPEVQPQLDVNKEAENEKTTRSQIPKKKKEKPLANVDLKPQKPRTERHSSAFNRGKSVDVPKKSRIARYVQRPVVEEDLETPIVNKYPNCSINMTPPKVSHIPAPKVHYDPPKNRKPSPITQAWAARKRNSLDAKRDQYIYTPGCSRAFLDAIAAKVNTQTTNDLLKDMPTIVPGLIKCIVLDRPTADRGLNLMWSLIRTFPMEFENFLEPLIKALEESSREATSDAQRIIMSIGNQIQAMFPADDLAAIASTMQTSSFIVKFISSLVIKDSCTLSNNEVAAKILGIARSMIDFEEFNSKRIIKAVTQKNPEVAASISQPSTPQTVGTKTSSPVKQSQAASPAKPTSPIKSPPIEEKDNNAGAEEKELPHVDEEEEEEVEVNLNLPEFDPARPEEWRSSVEAFARQNQGRWDEVRAALYKEICEAADKTPLRDVLFDLMLSFLKFYGLADYQIFYKKLIQFSYRQRRYTVPRTALDFILDNCDDVPDLIISLLQSNDEKDIINAANEATYIIEQNSDKMRDHLDSISSALSSQINHESAYVRKPVVYCFAKLVSTYGQTNIPRFSVLTPAQKSLILHYAK